MLQLLPELFIHDADIYKYLYSYLLGPHCATKKACIQILTRLSLCPHNTWLVVERKGESTYSWGHQSHKQCANRQERARVVAECQLRAKHKDGYLIFAKAFNPHSHIRRSQCSLHFTDNHTPTQGG